jgi:hypothetical protein
LSLEHRPSPAGPGNREGWTGISRRVPCIAKPRRLAALTPMVAWSAESPRHRGCLSDSATSEQAPALSDSGGLFLWLQKALSIPACLRTVFAV